MSEEFRNIPPSRTGATDASASSNCLSEVSREGLRDCLRQAQDVLPIEIGDHEPEEASRR